MDSVKLIAAISSRIYLHQIDNWVKQADWKRRIHKINISRREWKETTPFRKRVSSRFITCYKIQGWITKYISEIGRGMKPRNVKPEVVFAPLLSFIILFVNVMEISSYVRNVMSIAKLFSMIARMISHPLYFCAPLEIRRFCYSVHAEKRRFLLA